MKFPNVDPMHRRHERSDHRTLDRVQASVLHVGRGEEGVVGGVEGDLGWQLPAPGASPILDRLARGHSGNHPTEFSSCTFILVFEAFFLCEFVQALRLLAVFY